MRKRGGLKSPVRENRTPGSVRGPSGNRRSYRDGSSWCVNTVAGRCGASLFLSAFTPFQGLSDRLRNELAHSYFTLRRSYLSRMVKIFRKR
jgi:hypothetical protein